MNRKASITIFFSFVVVAIVVIMIGAIVGPFGAVFSSEVYTIGEGLINDSNVTIQSINNPEVKASLTGVTNNALSQTENNIEVSTFLFQYSWVFVLLLVGFVTFLLTRRQVELTGGFV
jgi:predicted PurR-regulated permease PerM